MVPLKTFKIYNSINILVCIFIVVTGKCSKHHVSLQLVKFMSAFHHNPIITNYQAMLFECWVIVHGYVVICYFFTKFTFSNISSRYSMKVSNGSNPDQDQQPVGPDLGPNCLQRPQKCSYNNISPFINVLLYNNPLRHIESCYSLQIIFEKRKGL